MWRCAFGGSGENARVRNAEVIGPNLLTFELMFNKGGIFFADGCYLPPLDKEEEVGRGWWSRPCKTSPLIPCPLYSVT